MTSTLTTSAMEQVEARVHWLEQLEREIEDDKRAQKYLDAEVEADGKYCEQCASDVAHEMYADIYEDMRDDAN